VSSYTTVIGTVPTPMYNPNKPYFDHHHTTWPKGRKLRPNGSRGRTIEVRTENPAVAEELIRIFGKVFKDVITEDRDD